MRSAAVVLAFSLLTGCQIDTLRPSLPADLGIASVRDLCAEYAVTGNTRLRDELRRRNLFTEDEWKRIRRGATNPIGYREPVLWCAWGLPGDHGEIVTTPSGATRYRYDIAGVSMDVIVEDGIVRSFDAR